MPRKGVTLGLFKLARLEQHLCERALSLAEMTVVFVRDVDADGVPERALGRRRVTFDEADPAEDHARPGGVARVPLSAMEVARPPRGGRQLAQCVGARVDLIVGQ